ncbi:MAG: hypothetical protein AABX73_03335 [Nanoarchaeota archaeon]
MEEKEKRIRAITNLYYSNKKLQESIVDFSKNREVVPRYFEQFGKRPDSIQYESDVIGLVRKGATSFHASEELWEDVFKLDSEMTVGESNSLRKSWDLLIDVDSPFLDCSKIATRLIIEALEQHGIKRYGVKFSGSKGFHIIVSGKAFLEEYEGYKTKEMFPEWARAISEYLMNYIKKDYNKEIGKILSEDDILRRTRLTKKDISGFYCKNCGKKAINGIIVNLVCNVCGMKVEKKDSKTSKRRLKCLNSSCAGILNDEDSREYYYCENCKDPDNKNFQLDYERHPENFEKVMGIDAEEIASLDLVLVAPRHLFRMPYSLHEKTALASVVLSKNELNKFEIKHADPLRVAIKDFLPDNYPGEGSRILNSAVEWKKLVDIREDKIEKKRYEDYKYEELKFDDVDESFFPEPIKKLLNGLEDGKKRGLFVLITFLRNLGFSPDKINKRIREWNEKNKPPLKEGYIRSQIEWHLKQKRKILPPNYDNDGFYRDLGLIDKKPDTKNPLVDVKRNLKRIV